MAACGEARTAGSTPSLRGTIGGVTPSVEDTFFLGGNVVTEISMTSFSGACDTLLSRNQIPKNSTLLRISLYPHADGNGHAVPLTAPATFESMGTGPIAVDTFLADWQSIGPSCGSTSHPATGGTVTITAASPSQLTGTLDLMFETAGISGTFVASSCVASDSAPHGIPTCL
jgi:hypothetical protein